MTMKYTKWSQNIANGRKMYQHFPLQDPSKFTQIGIFGLKMCHLATMLQTTEYFPDTTYRGHVILNTRSDGNFYFTPLGKSYICDDGEDQGPLKLYNQVPM
jgi:hypothetical protein